MLFDRLFIILFAKYLLTFFINYGYQEKQPDNPDFIVSSLAESAKIILGEFT